MAFGIKDCCEALGVSRSGYYQWQKDELGPRAQANQALGERIGEVFEAHKGRYGSPRVMRALRAAGVWCGEKRVARLMRERGWAARPKRAFRPRTTRAGATAAAPNLIKDLAPSGPDHIWVSDITYVATRQGWLYLAVILDFFSRLVVGWKLGETLEAVLVVSALQNALTRRDPPRGLTFHSDSRLPIQQRGRQKTAHAAGS
jgi:putative transposase